MTNKLRFMSMTLAGVMMIGSTLMPMAAAAEEAVTESAEETSSVGIWTDVAGEDGITYDNLFDVILTEDCYEIWYDNAVEFVGEEAAEATVDMLQSSISADIYGQEAVDAYASGEGLAFDCWYINGAQQFTFYQEGDALSAVIDMEDGTYEEYTYEYAGVYYIGEGETMDYGGVEYDLAFPVDVYQATEDAGEFTYILLRDDTMEATWHIEFRYGSDLDALLQYQEGAYAYWLAAGIDAEADDATIESVIRLFVEENVS